MTKSTSTATKDPSKYAQGYITPAANALQTTYNQSQPQANQASNDIYGQLPGLASKAFGTSPALGAAQGYATDVLGGKYLGANNPYTSAMLDATNRGVSDSVNSTFGRAGRTGGDQHVAVLGRSLADAGNQLRYTDYANERQAMQQTAGQVPGLESAQYSGIPSYLAAAQTAGQIPWQGTQNYANSTGGLVGGYTTQTQTSTPSFLDSATQIAKAAGSAYTAFSDRRLKKNIEQVGTLNDGLPVYEYDYIWGGERQRGVMADEVEQLRPWALGPKQNGFATVNYGAL
jgi:hypothetical protein